MERLFAAGLGVMLGFATAQVRAEEIEWKSAPPPRNVPLAPPRAAAEERADLQAPGTEAIVSEPKPGLLALPAADPPAVEPLGPPRKIEPTPTAPEAKPVRPATDAKDLRTSDLMADQAWSMEPAPSDPGRRFYFRGEYLLWFTKLMSSPPLVTTAAVPPGPIAPSQAFLGQPGTRILYGGGPIGEPFHQGGRYTAGLWLDECQTCGVETQYFFLGTSEQRFHADSTTSPILTRPFFRGNPPIPQQSGQIVAFPPGFFFPGGVIPVPSSTGAIDTFTSTSMWGAQINARECLCAHAGCLAGYRVDLFAGFRYLNLQDDLNIREDLIVGTNNAIVPAGTRVQVVDQFGTHDDFYGGQVGFEGEVRRGPLFAVLRMSLAMGDTHQVVVIDGRQFVTQPGGPTQQFVGGLLALDSNMGRRTANAFSIVPELTLNVGAQVGEHARLFVGYNFLCWTRVIRAAEQIDPVLDVNRVPNLVPPGVFPPIAPPRPRVPFAQNDFWAQGVQLGFELRW